MSLVVAQSRATQREIVLSISKVLLEYKIEFIYQLIVYQVYLSFKSLQQHIGESNLSRHTLER